MKKAKDVQLSVFWRRYYELEVNGDRKVPLEEYLYHAKISLSVCTQNINSPHAPLFGHPRHLVHNTVSRKPIVVHLSVNSNN
jgi:hypothetical protein